MAQVVLENIYKSFVGSTHASSPSSTQADGGDVTTTTAQPQRPKATASSPKLTSVLRAINLSIKDGEFMVLVGPSGCGKSTLLRLIAGLETATAGNIWVGDRCVNSLPPKARDIAMVFQSYALYPHLSVYDNLAFGLRRSTYAQGIKTRLPQWCESGLMAMTKALPSPFRFQSPRERAIQQQVATVSEMLQIQPLLERLPKQLSGGQKQRVALGRAMARNPQVFLMDEPLSNLDAKLRTETRAQIVKLQRQLGTTTIYVTHDQTEAMTMGDRIAVLNAGVIQQIATPLELYNTPANRFVAEFIGSPPMNFVSMQVVSPTLLHHAKFELTLSQRTAKPLTAYVGRTVWLGLRPEHMQAVANPGTATIPGTLPVEVDLIEALGHETFLTVRLLECEDVMQVRLPPDQIVGRCDRMALKPDLEKIHLFDADTEERIILDSNG